MVTVARVEESNAKGNSNICNKICGGTNIISFNIFNCEGEGPRCYMSCVYVVYVHMCMYMYSFVCIYLFKNIKYRVQVPGSQVPVVQQVYCKKHVNHVYRSTTECSAYLNCTVLLL
jgi:hypothetical protein